MVGRLGWQDQFDLVRLSVEVRRCAQARLERQLSLLLFLCRHAGPCASWWYVLTLRQFAGV